MFKGDHRVTQVRDLADSIREIDRLRAVIKEAMSLATAASNYCRHESAVTGRSGAPRCPRHECTVCDARRLVSLCEDR